MSHAVGPAALSRINSNLVISARAPVVPMPQRSQRTHLARIVREPMATWLKLVGAVDDPMPDPWLSGRSDLREEVGFNKRARVEIGEQLVLYAIPQRKIIALAQVSSHPAPGGTEARWPWRCKISLQVAIADYDRAPELSDLQVPGGRELPHSVGRQSHIELSWAEFELARAALDPAQGNLGAEPH